MNQAVNEILEEVIDELEGIADYSRNELRKAKIILNDKTDLEPVPDYITPEWLRIKLRTHHITGKELAETFGITNTTVSRWMKQGSIIPPLAKSALFYFFKSL